MSVVTTPLPDSKKMYVTGNERYSRQIRFASIGESGQLMLSKACVLIVGIGALGASLAQHMVRAGVGEVRLVDRDFVELSNLQRQSLFDEADAIAAMPKAVAAANKLRSINSEINIVAHVRDVDQSNVIPLVIGANLVLDGTDNLSTRLLLSDVCYRHRIPFLFGGVAGSQGMSAALIPGRTACLRCLIGEAEEDGEGDTCDTVGVLSPTVEFVASLQAVEAMKWLSGNGDSKRRTWINADLWSFCLRESNIPSGRADCSYCGDLNEDPEPQPGPKADDVEGETIASTVLCGRNSVQVTLAKPLLLDQLERSLTLLGCQMTVNRYLVKAVLPHDTGEQLVLFSDGRVLVQGTADVVRAIELCRIYLIQD